MINRNLLIIIVVVIALIVFLMKQFPEALTNENNKINLVQSLLLIGLIGSGIAVRFRDNLSTALKQISLWSGFFVVVIIAYSYRFEFNDLKQRFLGELIPSDAVYNEKDGSVTIKLSEDGHFHVNAYVSGKPVQFMLDTGASDVVITKDVARRIGIKPDDLEFSRVYYTANGVTYGAPVVLKEITIGNITVRNVKASVNRSDMDKPLLGMSFLNRLSSYEVRDDSLTMRE